MSRYDKFQTNRKTINPSMREQNSPTWDQKPMTEAQKKLLQDLLGISSNDARFSFTTRAGASRWIDSLIQQNKDKPKS